MAGAPAGVVDARVLLQVDGTTAAYERTLAKIPGFTDTQAKKAADAWRRQHLTKIAKDIAGLDKINADATANMAKNWGDVGKQITSLVGGPFGQLGQIVFDLVPKSTKAASSLGTAGAAIGAVGGAATATLAAVAALGTAVVSLANKAVAARDRLIEAGKGAEIDPEALESLRAYDKAIGKLRTSVDLLTVAVGSEMAATIVGAIDLANRAADAFDGWSESLRGISELGGKGLRAVLMVGTVGLSELAIAANESGHAIAAAEAATLDYADAMAALGMTAEDAIVDEEIRQDVIRRGNEALAARKKAEEEAARAAKKRAEEVLAAEQAIRDELLTQNEAALERRARDAAQQIAEADRVAAERIAAEKAYADNAKRVALEVGAVWRKQHEDAVEQRWEFAEQAASAGEAIVAASIANIDTTTKAGRAQAKKLFEWQKTLGLVGVGINTAAAVVKAFAMFGPPPSPAGIAAAAAATAAGVTQAATISSQKASFFGGGVVPGKRGEPVPIMAHGGESVIPSHVADRMGPEAVADLVAGKLPTAAPPVVHVLVQIDGKNIPARTHTRTGMHSPFGRT